MGSFKSEVKSQGKGSQLLIDSIKVKIVIISVVYKEILITQRNEWMKIKFKRGPN